MQGVSREIKEIESNYNTWLAMSNLTEKEFLKNRTISNFKILGGADGKYTIIVIGKVCKDEKFVKIGEQMAFETDNKEARMNCCLLLMYIANKLDEMNNKAPKFEQRGLYFTEITKKFIKENALF